MNKSPFFVVEDFLSPLMCEEIIDYCNFNVPDVNKEGKETRTTKSCALSEEIIFNRFAEYKNDIENRYQIEYRAMESPKFNWLPPDNSIAPHCENSKHINNKWVRVNHYDLSAVVFLSDYQDTPPLDQQYEVYGGKLEFPQHQFGFNPQRGTLIVYPSAPHFINCTTSVIVGDYFDARFHISAKQPFFYNPVDFPGNYLTWFK